MTQRCALMQLPLLPVCPGPAFAGADQPRTVTAFRRPAVYLSHSSLRSAAAFQRVLCQQAEAELPLLPDTEDGLRDYLAQWDAAIEAAS